MTIDKSLFFSILIPLREREEYGVFQKRIRNLIEDAKDVLHLGSQLLNAMSFGWMKDILNHTDEGGWDRFRPDTTDPETDDVKHMKLARRGKIYAVYLIEKDANLLALIEDPQVLDSIRQIAISRLQNLGTITCLALSRDVFMALAAVKQLQDEYAVAVVLLHSPHVSVRVAAAKRCVLYDALQRAANDPDELVRSEARLRIATFLHVGGQMSATA